MSDLISRHRSVLAPVIDFDNEIEVVAADGSYITAADGRRYLDFACGIAVSNLGHQPPAVKRAMLEQLDKFWHAGATFRYETIVLAAERLGQVTPQRIDSFVFMNSGAEAVEAAVKLARKTSGRQGIMTFRGGFHGRSMGSVSYTTSKAKYRQGYHPLVGSVFTSAFPRPYRWGVSQEEADERALFELEEKLRHEITPGEIACFLIEPMQGEGGYYPAGRAFMTALREIADEHGILLIADEVQSGFGRTGTWFTIDQYDVAPDILVMGKAIANGIPLSAVGAPKPLLDSWPPGSHGTTYGGNPIACAAAAATIETLADVIPQVPKVSDHAFDRWNEISAAHPTIGDVRGLGLMIGVELVSGDRTPSAEALRFVKRFAQDEGMLILSCGPDGNVIRFIPPLNVSLEDLDRGIEILERGIDAWEQR
jgi:4-aminobutyrate aminotransferase